MNKERQEAIKKLKTWILPKDIQIQELNLQIQSQELMVKQIDENVKFNFYTKQQQKLISEQTSESSKKLMELELERIQRDLDASYYPQKAQFILNGLKDSLEKEEKIFEELKRKITLVERNHKPEETKQREEPKTIPEGMTKEEAGRSKETYLEPDEDPNKPKTGRSFQG